MSVNAITGEHREQKVPQHLDADTKVENLPLSYKIMRTASEFFFTILIALLMVGLIGRFLFCLVYIPSSSMYPTLKIGDRLIVNKRISTQQTLQRGDVIVFADPANWISSDLVEKESQFTRVMQYLLGNQRGQSRGLLVKRLIGMPGDQVSCDGSGKPIKINGVPVNEPYIAPGLNPSDLSFNIKVPAGMVWVMGDNRANSADSRLHQDDPHGGAVPISLVIGRVGLRLYPWESKGIIKDMRQVFAAVPDPTK